MEITSEIFNERQQAIFDECDQPYAIYDAQTVDRMRTIWAADMMQVFQIIQTKRERKDETPMISQTTNGFFWKIGYGQKNKPIKHPFGHSTGRIFISTNNDEGREWLAEYVRRTIIAITLGKFDKQIAAKLESYNSTPKKGKAKEDVFIGFPEVFPSSSDHQKHVA